MDENNLFESLGLSEDELQADVVDQQSEDVTDEGTEEPVTEEEPVEEVTEEAVVDVANQQQTHAENHLAAQARKQAEAERRRIEMEAQRVKGENELLLDALRRFGFEGGAQEIADQIEAQRTGIEVEDVRLAREARQAEIDEVVANHPAIRQYEMMNQMAVRRMNEETINRELQEIQRINPEVTGLNDLKLDPDANDAFRSLVQSGIHIDKAYKIVYRPVHREPPVDTKSHIKTVNGSQTQGTQDISHEELNFFNKLMPGLSKKEISDLYKKTK